ncbi:type II secretion system protein XpsN [Lysobacter sp. HA35]
MRLDHVAPRTLLLGAFAGWAVLAWVLALAGMGGHLPEGKGGAIEGSRIPTLPANDASPGLGPIGQYGEIAARPLFATDRRPHPFSLVTENGQADAPTDFDLVLTSVLISPQASIAIVQKPDGSESWRVKIGDAADSRPNWRLISLKPRSAVFEGPEGQKELTLRVYDGKGGSAPTASTSSAPVNTTMMNSPAPSTPAPPPTDASPAPDPAQIEQIRQRIEARREEMRRRAQNANPPATAVPPPTTR